MQPHFTIEISAERHLVAGFWVANRCPRLPSVDWGRAPYGCRANVFWSSSYWLDGGKQKTMNTCNTQSLAIHALASSFLASSDELGGTEHPRFFSSISFISLMASRMPLLSAMEKHPAWLLVRLQELLLYRCYQFLSKGQTITVTPQKDLLPVPKSRSWAHPKQCKNYSGNLCSWVLALRRQQGKAGLCRKQNLQISVTLWERSDTPNLHTHFGCVNISELQF